MKYSDALSDDINFLEAAESKALAQLQQAGFAYAEAMKEYKAAPADDKFKTVQDCGIKYRRAKSKLETVQETLKKTRWILERHNIMRGAV